jgi:hypothetical protein
VIDPESGIVSSNGCATTTLSTDTAGSTITCSATNGAGLSKSASVTIKIDQTLPAISGMPPAGCTFRSEDHKFVRVAIVTAADRLSGMASFTVTGTSNEPSDSNDSDDIRIRGSGLDPREVYLRANDLEGNRKDGLQDQDNGREHEKEYHAEKNPKIYTLTATASDLAGNSATAVAVCTVKRHREE